MEELQVVDRRFQPEETAVTDRNESPNAVVMMAMEKGYSPELIEKMMDLQERFEKNEARKAYFESLAKFKAEAPTVKKDKYNNRFNSWFTSIGVLLDTYNPVLGRHGLSISFPILSSTDKTTMTVECRLSHRLGHSESISMTAPIDQAAIGKTSGQPSRNAIQDIKSTFTYLRSMTAEGVLGVAGTEASANDDDGNSAGTEYITTDQCLEISGKMKELKVDAGAFFTYLTKALKTTIEGIEEIPARGYQLTLAALKAKEGKK